MKITEKTIAVFKKKGYELRPTYYEYDKYWEEGYEFSYNYYSMETLKRCYKNLSDEEIEEKRNKDAIDFANRRYSRYCWYDDSTELFVLKDGIIICHIKNLSKYGEVTDEFIQKRIDKAEKAYNSYYGGFCRSVQDLLKREQIEHGFSIYPTTYGIGVWVFYNYHAKECIDTVTELLKKYGIEYYNEFSEARWVFRFKISKKETNRIKLSA